jgi:uncharacterized protein YkwD
MSKVFLPGIAFGSVLLTTGSISIPAQAQKIAADIQVTTTPIYLAQSTNISTASLEQKVLAQINQYRNQRGLRSLSVNATIRQQARLHSQNMASGRVPFGHQGFQERLNAIAKIIPLMGIAENVAYNMGYADPASNAVRGWLNSPGHRLNIEGNYNLTGVGVAKSPQGAYYFTQIFVRSR